MNIRYYLRGTKEIKNIYVRLVSKGIDVSAPIGIFMRENQWDSKKEVCRSPKSTAILFKLKGILMDRYNQSYCSGEVIDKEWVKNVVKEAFKRPKQEVGLVSKEHTVYLVPFAKYWLEEHARSWKVSAMETMGENLKKQYSNFVLMLELYEDSRHTKTKLKEANVDFIYDFVSYMLKEQKLSRSTAHRNIIRLKFFLKRAVELDFETHKDYLKPVYLEKQPEVQDVYLSEAEIQKMYDLDISGDYKLEAAKDNFIMSCWLGLRVSDFMTRFDASSIKDGYVSIKTQKTGSFEIGRAHV